MDGYPFDSTKITRTIRRVAELFGLIKEMKRKSKPFLSTLLAKNSNKHRKTMYTYISKNNDHVALVST